MQIEVLADPQAVEALAPEWDEVVVDSSRPLMSPAWLLAWWRHVAPPGAELRVVTAREGGRLVGLAPLWCRPTTARPVRYRFLGAGVSLRGGPLARPGREAEVAAAVAHALADMKPRVGMVMFDGVPDEWLEAVARAWPGGRPWRAHRFVAPAPFVRYDEPTFEDWWAGRSRNFRQQISHSRREFDRAGGVFRFSRTPDELTRDLKAFAALHYDRWRAKGGSDVLTPEVERMLLDAGRAMLADERLRLWCLDVDGRTINAEIFLAAGSRLTYWLGGFDEAWSRHRPALTGLAALLEATWKDGYEVLDLGAGGQPYKYRLADADEDLAWEAIVPSGAHSWTARAELIPTLARQAVVSRLPPEAKDRLKRLMGRGPSAT